MTDSASPQFEDQGGAATMDPPAIARWLTSKIMSRMASLPAQDKRRAKAERTRMRRGERHRIDYFHQLDDAYSYLAAQLLRPLVERYDVDLHCHVVGQLRDRNFPEPDLLGPLGRYDAGLVAPHYGLDFPQPVATPDAEGIELAERILVTVDAKDFPEVAIALGSALFSGNREALEALASRHEPTSQDEARRAIEAGNATRDKLGHYIGGSFHCSPEWYWGPDRFYHLENRLVEFGAARDKSDARFCPRPAIESGPLRDDGSLVLDFYPSLRSPYTSIVFDKTVALAQEVGVRLEIKPVLPMVMRGVPVTQRKGAYIMRDTAREARTLGVEWGPFYDPIGDPVRNAYSLYPWAREQGKGTEFLSSFLERAWFQAVNTNSDRGMQQVVETAGLDWNEARGHLGDPAWVDEVEANRLEMYGFGSWGVPSYRLRTTAGDTLLAVWGQDRLWLVAREIQRWLGEHRD